jgi:hypothetical protein
MGSHTTNTNAPYFRHFESFSNVGLMVEHLDRNM